MRRPLLLLLGLAALPAAAQDRPLFIPSRDVAVTYRVTAGPAAGREMTMAWLVAAQRLRVDAAQMPGWSVVDRANGRMLMVLEAQKLVMEVPMQGGPGGLSLPSEPPASARFTRTGSATIAGHACTTWRYEDGANKGEACLTADGVMLRSSGGQGAQSGTVEAVSVAYGPQDPARFQAPPGYRSMQMPAGAVPPGTAAPAR